MRTLSRQFPVIPAICMLLLFIILPFAAFPQKKKSKKSVAESDAIYTTSTFGQYMTKWWILDPVLISKDSTANHSEEVQKQFFESDPIAIGPVGKETPPVKVNDLNLKWKFYENSGMTINLDSLFKKDYAMAFASATVIADSAHSALLAVGSDDAVKIWHNGKLIHKNWIPRGITPDQDLVTVSLVKGENQLTIAVQDMTLGWGFTARFLDKKSLGDRLIMAAFKGSLDDVNFLIERGADINAKNIAGLSVLNAARLSGRQEVAKLLEEKGAKKEPMPAPEALVDRMYRSVDLKPSPAVVVLVSKDGKILYKKAFGYADIVGKIKASTETKFRIGSITKQFTAAAILKLQEENKLHVTDKLSKYYPSFPGSDEVTLHHLLTHTSGIHSYTNKPDFIEKVVNSITADELLKYFKDDPYDFKPGEQARYNNSGYLLLGYIVEKASGKGYDQYLKETFFDPLGMTNTGIHRPDLKLLNEAKGYWKNNGKYEPAPNWNMVWAGGAGAIYSTVDDLHKWNDALFNGKVLNSVSFDAATTPIVLNNGTKPTNFEYGYGLALGKYREISIVQHGGGLHGFISQLSRYPEHRLTVAVLTNISPPEANLDANAIAEFYLWESLPAQASYSVKGNLNQDLQLFEGRYDFGNGAVMLITSEGNQLYAQLTGQQKFPIFASDRDAFFWKVVDAKIKFVRNENNEVTGGLFTQGSNQINAQKLKDESIVQLDPSTYKKFAGKYDYGNNFMITISVENNKIYAQGTNQPRLEIFPVSDTEFIVREANARIVFFDGPDGKVSKLNLDMAGQKKDAPKVPEP